MTAAAPPPPPEPEHTPEPEPPAEPPPPDDGYHPPPEGWAQPGAPGAIGPRHEATMKIDRASIIAAGIDSDAPPKPRRSLLEIFLFVIAGAVAMVGSFVLFSRVLGPSSSTPATDAGVRAAIPPDARPAPDARRPADAAPVVVAVAAADAAPPTKPLPVDAAPPPDATPPPPDAAPAKPDAAPKPEPRPPRPPRPPTGERPPAVHPTDDAAQVARDTYTRGNEALFAGDTAAAIQAYTQTLRIAPGYVAAYRGLGLAYSQRGETAKAIQSFERYIRAAPRAKDVPLIQRRIQALKAK